MASSASAVYNATAAAKLAAPREPFMGTHETPSACRGGLGWGVPVRRWQTGHAPGAVGAVWGSLAGRRPEVQAARPQGREKQQRRRFTCGSR